MFLINHGARKPKKETLLKLFLKEKLSNPGKKYQFILRTCRNRMSFPCKWESIQLFQFCSKINEENPNMKPNKTKLAIFEGKKIRRQWNGKEEKWYFSVVDIVTALTNSVNPRDYWFKMKIRVKTDERTELSTFCRQLKLPASDNKYYLTDVANTEGIFRIIQSIPSPNAEPFKLWLARVGYERIEETEDPEPLSFPRKWESRDCLYRFPVKLGMTLVYV